MRFFQLNLILCTVLCTLMFVLFNVPVGYISNPARAYDIPDANINFSYTGQAACLIDVDAGRVFF